MPLYTMLLDARLFHRDIVPALADCWRRRSFAPCRTLCADLLTAARAFAAKYHIARDDLLLLRTSGLLPFDRHYWQLLVGEILMVAAAEIPEIEIDPATLCCLLASGPHQVGTVPRSMFAPIEQALYGARDLVFGTKLFRPEHAGYNDVEDLIRLAAYLAGIDMKAWNRDQLRTVPGLTDDAEREEELEHARQWFPQLVELYERAAAAGQVIVAEML